MRRGRGREGERVGWNIKSWVGKVGKMMICGFRCYFKYLIIDLDEKYDLCLPFSICSVNSSIVHE